MSWPSAFAAAGSRDSRFQQDPISVQGRSFEVRFKKWGRLHYDASTQIFDPKRLDLCSKPCLNSYHSSSSFYLRAKQDSQKQLKFSGRCMGSMPHHRRRQRSNLSKKSKALNATYNPAAPNYPLRDPKYHLIETIRPLIELHWGV